MNGPFVGMLAANALHPGDVVAFEVPLLNREGWGVVIKVGNVQTTLEDAYVTILFGDGVVAEINSKCILRRSGKLNNFWLDKIARADHGGPLVRG